MRPKSILLRSYDWENDNSGGWEPWGDEALRAREDTAAALISSDPEAAMAELHILSEEGSIFADRWLGYCYQGLTTKYHDLERAEHHLYKAQMAGSWPASVELSKLLFEEKINDKWEAILEDGHQQGFIPSTFWLARFRYMQSKTRATAMQVRPLLEKAADAGHPAARLMLAQLKGRGMFGIRAIPQGFREVNALYDEFGAEPIS
ncbi:hypothetical protein [Qipengyuania sp. JC766]|uniref:hypothetical protein n=1 Tax=Qipengyuania sp. JC766 TaxID=3232139 RepID=UPI00345AF1BF